MLRFNVPVINVETLRMSSQSVPVSATDPADIVTLVHENGSRAEIHRYGAHVIQWRDAAGHDRLFLSSKAVYGNGTSIRGGIPVVFPQFANEGPLPKHGFLRSRPWTLFAQSASSATFRASDDEMTRAVWPYRFEAELTVTLGDDLAVALSIANIDRSEFRFTAALHNYFQVEDVANVRIDGLDGVTFIDKTRDNVTAAQRGSVTISEEIDRIYRQAPPAVRLMDKANGTGLVLQSDGFGDWVVWNPGPGSTLFDMESNGYRTMVCVEAARITVPMVLAPSERWTGTQRFRIANSLG